MTRQKPTVTATLTSERVVGVRGGIEAVAQRVDAVGERVGEHDGAQPAGGLVGGEERAGEQPQRQQDEVDDGVEGLGRIHGPRDGEAERGDLKADEQNDGGSEQHAREAWDARRRAARRAGR